MPEQLSRDPDERRANEALRWLLRDSEDARRIREHVHRFACRLEVEGVTEYGLSQCYDAMSLLCPAGRARGWKEAARKAWNQLSHVHRVVLTARYLAHALGDGPKAERLWPATVAEVTDAAPRVALEQAESTYAALYQAILGGRCAA
jgi:hypothetical protein